MVATIVGLFIFLPSDSVSAISVPDDISKSTDAQAVNIYLNPDIYNFSKSTDLTKESVNSLSGYADGSLVIINTRKISGEAGSWMRAGSGGKGIAKITLGRDSGSGGAEYVVGFYKPVQLTISLANSTAQEGQVEVSSSTKVWKVYSKISDAQVGYGIQDAQYSQLAAYPTVQYKIKVNYFSTIDLTFKGIQDNTVGGGSSDPLIVAILGKIQNITSDMANLVASSSRHAQDILTLKGNLQGNATKVKNVEVAVEGLDQRVSRLESNAQNTTTARTCNLNTNLYPNVEICLSKQNGQYQAYTFYVNRAILGDNITIMVGTQTVAMQILDATLAYYTYIPSQAGTYTVTFAGSKSSWSMVVTVV